MNLLSPSTNLRTMSLAILEKIADIKYDIVLEIVLPKIDTISKNVIKLFFYHIIQNIYFYYYYFRLGGKTNVWLLLFSLN